MNDWFQFKQFKVQQDKCAMKVCTDACLFGAWVAAKIKKGEFTPRNILDIGSGTGLLSLMLAQKSEAYIDAVEIAEEAFIQSQENIESSRWANRITTFLNDISTFSPGKKYELIICNPPFYDTDLKSPNAKRNTAMHSIDLSLANLATAIKQHLAKDGKAAVLLPFAKTSIFKKSFEQEQLFIEEELHIAHQSGRPHFRTILVLSFLKNTSTVSTLAVKEPTGEYSKEFITLLKEYYLNL